MDYQTAGVDTQLAQTFVKSIKPYVDQTCQPGVLGGLGGFAGLFEVPTTYQTPVLVAGTDGVGTKLKVAQACASHHTVGLDLVAMCVNDVLSVGAKPLFFLDYVATGRLDPEQLTMVVAGIAAGCEQAGCALLGGETAEMPGFYPQGEYDLAGFCVGIVEKTRILNGTQVQLGDRVLGLPSSGVHSNGFSLVRRIVEERGWGWETSPLPGSPSLGELLLTPTVIYVSVILNALQAGLDIHGMAHITGGGLPENAPRCLGPDQSIQIEPNSWKVPRLFQWLQAQGSIETLEMFRTFNMGIGFIVIVSPEQVEQAQTLLPEAIDIGQVVAGPGDVLGLEQWAL